MRYHEPFNIDGVVVQIKESKELLYVSLFRPRRIDEHGLLSESDSFEMKLTMKSKAKFITALEGKKS